MTRHPQPPSADSQPLSTTAPECPDDRRWERLFWQALATLFALRLILLWLSPLDLSGDEAYYWDWGRRPDWGYYSKPPMIAWLMALASATTGATTFGIRIWALFFATGACALVFLLAKDLFGRRAGFYAGLATALCPALLLLSQVFTIDPPLMFFWSLALWSSWRLIRGAIWSPGWAAMAGLAVAAGVLTKQMMLVFPLLLLLFLASDAVQRPKLKDWRWWALALLPIAALAPPLIWNAQHGWITFQHTGSHFGSGETGFGERLIGAASLVAIVMLMVGPVVAYRAFGSVVPLLRRWTAISSAYRFLAVFCVPALGAFLVLSLRQRILPNWPAVYLLPLFILFGAWAADRARSASSRRAGNGALWTSGAIAGVAYVALFAIPLLNLKRSPFERAQSWKPYAEAIAAAEERAFGETPHFVLVAGHRYYASHLAFYHPQRPRVYRWEPSGRPHSQYEMWPGFEESGQSQGLLVVPLRSEADLADPLASPTLAGLAERLTSITPLEHVTLPLNERRERVFALYRIESPGQ